MKLYIKSENMVMRSLTHLMEEGAVWAQEVQVPDAAQCPWMKIARDPSVLTEPLPPKQEEKA